jgi:hypothetical protein
MYLTRRATTIATFSLCCGRRQLLAILEEFHCILHGRVLILLWVRTLEAKDNHTLHLHSVEET